ncbi:MAG TPA: flagellar motor protein MotB [Symbiobacteriaceae bacterium]|nr:flagellar motor protein MotB [Symbiobacteriaceae bacterium]
MSSRKAKHKAGGHGGGGQERWLLTYADMITLLMALFIMLFAMSTVDKEKYAAVAAMFQKAFGGGNLIVPVQGVGDGVSAPPPKESVVLDPKKVQEMLEQLGQGLYADFARDGRFSVYMSERGLTISLAGNAFFDSGKAELKPEMVPLLDEIARRVKDLPNDISVEGFTDSDPIATAEFPSNWYLSVARANQVRDYMESRGVASQRLIVVGYGETRPLYDNGTAEGKAKNRRVDVVILRQQQVIDRGQEISGDKK